MRIYRHLFDRDNSSINLCFLFNAIGSTLLMPLALLYLAGNALTAKEILYIGTVKFWSYSFSLFFVVPLANRLPIKKTILVSLFIKLLSLAALFTGQSFVICMLVMLINGLATSFFSIASKFYIRATSDNISESFSVRMTLNNVGSAVSPLVISALVYCNVPFHYALLILILLYAVGVGAATGLQQCARADDTPVTPTRFAGLFSKESAMVATLSILFAMLYYTFETIVPLELVQAERKEFIGPVMLLNTGLIIVGQLPVYHYFTKKIGVIKALLLSTAACIALFLPWFLQLTELPGLLLIVLGVTFLEMFYGAGIDTVITSANCKSKVALLDGISSVALSAGAAIAAAIYSDAIMFLPLAVTLFVLTFLFVRGETRDLA